MRRYLKYVYNTVLLVSFVACSEVQPEYYQFWSEVSRATIDAINGSYSMESAQWSQPIDLSGNGIQSENILQQMERYGWTGRQSVQEVSILCCSNVARPESPRELAQVDLFVPFPERSQDNSAKPLEQSGRCSLDVHAYQFHYQVDSRGWISLFNVSDRQMNGDGGTLSNVEVRFEGRRIYFEANTALYDWSTESWQDGHMSLIFVHN